MMHGSMISSEETLGKSQKGKLRHEWWMQRFNAQQKSKELSARTKKNVVYDF